LARVSAVSPKDASEAMAKQPSSRGPARLQGQGPLAEPGGEGRGEIGERDAPCPLDSSAGGRSPLQLPKSGNPRASPLALFPKQSYRRRANLNKRPGGAATPRGRHRRISFDARRTLLAEVPQGSRSCGSSVP
jgi:hypothetical protein